MAEGPAAVTSEHPVRRLRFDGWMARVLRVQGSAPDLIRGGYRFSEKDFLKRNAPTQKLEKRIPIWVKRDALSANATDAKITEEAPC